MKPENGRLSILLVEDDDIDILAVRRSFARLGFDWAILVAHDGIEALEVLRGGKRRAGLAQPFLILLDLSLPRMSGLEFLAELRKDEQLRQSIVFVLTTSAAESDISAAYAFNVAGFISKRGAEDTVVQVVRLAEIYSRTVHFPK